MICWRRRAFLRSRRPPTGSLRVPAWPRLLAESPSLSSLIAGADADGCLGEIFTRGIMLFLLHGAPGRVHQLYCDSGPNIIVTNARLQAPCVFLLRAAGKNERANRQLSGAEEILEAGGLAIHEQG